MRDDTRFSLLELSISWPLERRMVVIPPRATVAYEPGEWHGALVVVELGEIELECSLGDRYQFATGDVLSLHGLDLCALHNRGVEPVVLVAISRRRGLEPEESFRS